MPIAILTLVAMTPNGLSRLELRGQMENNFSSIKLGKDGVYYYRTVRRLISDGRLKETKGGRLKLPSPKTAELAR